MTMVEQSVKNYIESCFQNTERMNVGSRYDVFFDIVTLWYFDLMILSYWDIKKLQYDVMTLQYYIIVPCAIPGSLDN